MSRSAKLAINISISTFKYINMFPKANKIDTDLEIISCYGMANSGLSTVVFGCWCFSSTFVIYRKGCINVVYPKTIDVLRYYVLHMMLSYMVFFFGGGRV